MGSTPALPLRSCPSTSPNIDVGDNIGARLKIDQAEADKKVAQAQAERQRALAVAREQEMQALVQENRAKVVLAEAEVPKAIAVCLPKWQFRYYGLLQHAKHHGRYQHASHNRDTR